VVTVLWTTDMSRKQVVHSETMRQLPELSRTERSFTRQVLYCGLGLMQMSHDRYAGLVTVDECTMWTKG